MTAPTQPAIETIREGLRDCWDPVISPSFVRWCDECKPCKARLALSAVEADLRRKEEALLRISEWGQNCTIPEGFEAADVRDAMAMIARSGLAPVSPSEPVPQQAEDVPS